MTPPATRSGRATALSLMVASTVLGLASTVGSDLAAAIVLRNPPLGAVNLFWAPILALPFVLVGAMSADLVKLAGKRRAMVLFATGEALLAILCFRAYYSTHEALAEHRPTAASLPLIFVPFEAMAPLLLSFVVWLVYKLKV